MWSVGLTGAGLNVPPRDRPAEYLDIVDDDGVLTQVVDVTSYDATAGDLQITWSIGDYKNTLTVTEDAIALEPVTTP
jgi:hypothetical protein